MSALEAVSPIDGRYSNRVMCLRQWFSEKALIEKRIHIELLYLKCIMSYVQPSISPIKLPMLNYNFAEQVKQIETKTNHDVKASRVLHTRDI